MPWPPCLSSPTRRTSRSCSATGAVSSAIDRSIRALAVLLGFGVSLGRVQRSEANVDNGLIARLLTDSRRRLIDGDPGGPVRHGAFRKAGAGRRG